MIAPRPNPAADPQASALGAIAPPLGATLEHLVRDWLHAMRASPLPTTASDSVAQNMLRVVPLALLLLAAAGLALGLAGWVHPHVAMAYAALGAISVGAQTMASRGSHQNAAVTLVVGLFVLTLITAMIFGGAHATSVASFLVLIALAGWLLGTRWALHVTLATVFALGLLLAAEHSGHLPKPPEGRMPLPQALLLLMQVSAMVAVTVLSKRSHEVALQAERRIAQDLLQRDRNLRLLTWALDQAPNSIMIIGASGKVMYANSAFLAATGFEMSEVLGADSRDLGDRAGLDEHYRQAETVVRQGQPWYGDRTIVRKDNTMVVETSVVMPVRDDAGETMGVLVMGQDVTRERLMTMHAQTLANYDALTALPNERQLRMRLERAFEQSRNSGEQSGVAMVNLRRFRSVNSARGREFGDRVLKAAAEQLARTVRASDLVARHGSNEFAIYLHGLGSNPAEAAQNARSAAEKIHAALARVHVAEAASDEQLAAGARRSSAGLQAAIGIALLPMDDQDTPAEATRRALVALMRADADLQQRATAVFDAGIAQTAEQRYLIESELEEAIVQGQLRVYLQGQAVAQEQAQEEASCAEALVRWHHPSRGVIQPADFIRVAEDAGLIARLETWVVQEVCQIIARADRMGQRVRVAVNISPRHFADAGFVTTVKRCIEQTGIQAQSLVIEVTESVAAQDLEEVVSKMRELRDFGVRFSLDDFGTGYSSLSYLRLLPLHEIKIDRSFVQDAVTDPAQATLVEAMLAVARRLGLQVVAEGVETPEQAHFIRSREPTAVLQGYLYARPQLPSIWLENMQRDKALASAPPSAAPSAPPSEQPPQQPPPAAPTDEPHGS